MALIGRQSFKSDQKLQVPSRTQGRQNVARGGKYIVTSGDTACSIANRYGVGCDDLLAANGLGRGSVLAVGMTLIVPGSLGQSPSAGYTVGKGDSVCSIASRHGVDCDKLLAANGLSIRVNLFFLGNRSRFPV